ncbi:MAG: methyltransferase domain-containing protein [Nitrososphaerota archaeon]|nr:methyltransferase domain-containing protein [Nitrososphaerota archaeon]MDG7024853.1 methyltransferase domain-containing protein [Nitrososphaerota archaeon]
MNTDLLLEVLAPSSGERILDVGAGSGRVADRVMKASGGAEVYAVDPNEKRAESMKKEFPAIRSSVASAESLPFTDSFFDKVYSTMALHHFSDLDRALYEVARVLKPGGSFIVLEVEPGSKLGSLFRFFGKAIGEHMGMLTREQLQGRLESVGGFRVVRSGKQGSRYLIQASRA